MPRILADQDYGNAARPRNVPDPQQAGDVVNLRTLLQITESLTAKAAVRVATTVDLSLSNPPSNIDGIALSLGDRVLVKNQILQYENGIYVKSAQGLIRATDFDDVHSIVPGSTVTVTSGTENGLSTWVLATTGNVVVNTTPIVFRALLKSTGVIIPAHAATHGAGGDDAITVAQSQVTGLDAALADKADISHGSEHGIAGTDPIEVAQSQVTGLDLVLAGKAPLVHGAEHHEDGTDPITLTIGQIDGLVAALSDKAALLHAAKHESGGDDELALQIAQIVGLADTLAEKAESFHAGRHGPGAPDEIAISQDQVIGLLAALATKASVTHAGAHSEGSSDPIAITQNQVSGLVAALAAKAAAVHKTTHVVGGSDELTLAQSQITGLETALASKAAATHATQHGAAGSDPLTLATSQITGLDSALANKAAALHAAQHTVGGSDQLSLEQSQISGLVSALNSLSVQLANKAPALHAGQHGEGGGDPLSLSQNQIVGLVAALAAKASATHSTTHGIGQSDELTLAISQISGLVSALANKAALDHAARHGVGQPDAITIAASQVTGLGAAATKNLDVPNGVAGLDGAGKLASSVIPALAITDTYVVGSQAAMLATGAGVGDVAIRTDESKSYILRVEPATVLANWSELLSAGGGGGGTVLSVNGQTGVVVISAAGLGALVASNNLSDVTNVVTARSSLGLGTAATRDTGTGTAQVILGDDARLTNSRTPTPHQGTHIPGGSDALPWLTIHGRGALGARPAASAANAGYLYYDTTNSTLYRSSGSAWETYAEVGGGGGGSNPTGPAGGDLFGSYPNPSVVQVTAVDKAFAYDGSGNLLSVTDVHGSKTFTYTDGELTGIVGTGLYASKTLAYTDGKLTSVTVV